MRIEKPRRTACRCAAREAQVTSQDYVTSISRIVKRARKSDDVCFVAGSSTILLQGSGVWGLDDYRGMKIKDLIDGLKKYAPEAEIFIHADSRRFESPMYIGLMNTAHISDDERNIQPVISP